MCFKWELLLLLLDLLDLEDLEDFEPELEPEDDDDDDEEEEEDDWSFAAWAYARSSAYFYSSRIFGASCKKDLKSSVKAPSPIDVKKFTANLAFAIVSLGKMPFRWSLMASSSVIFFTNGYTPRFSAISWIRILKKILLADVVSSSVSLMAVKQLQSMLSV